MNSWKLIRVIWHWWVCSLIKTLAIGLVQFKFKWKLLWGASSYNSSSMQRLGRYKRKWAISRVNFEVTLPPEHIIHWHNEVLARPTHIWLIGTTDPARLFGINIQPNMSPTKIILKSEFTQAIKTSKNLKTYYNIKSFIRYIKNTTISKRWNKWF